MAVSIITLYLAGQQVQVVEGSQYHFIVASMGATAQPPVPGPVVRPDPFPQYVHDDEIGDLLADAAVPATDPVVAALLGDGGSQTRAALDALDLGGDAITPEAVEANLPSRLSDVELRAAFVSQVKATGVAATDTAAINAALAASGAGAYKAVRLVGDFVINAPLVIPSKTTLDAAAATITLAPGSNCNMLRNSNYAGPSRDSDIVIVGGTWDRGGNGGAGNNLHSLFLRRIDNLRVEKLTYTSTTGSKYGIAVGDVTRYAVRDIISPGTSSDLIHVTGPATDGVIERVYNSGGGDDIIGITTTDYTTYDDVHGPINRLRIRDVAGASSTRIVLVSGSASGSGDGFDISDIDIDGVVQTGTGSGIYIAGPSGTSERIENVTIRRLRQPATAPGVYLRARNLGRIVVADSEAVSATHPLVSVSPEGGQVGHTIDHLILRNCRKPSGGGNLVEAGNASSVITRLSVEGGSYAGSTAAFYLACASVGAATIRDFRYTGTGGLLLIGASANVGQVTVSGLNATFAAAQHAVAVANTTTVDTITFIDPTVTAADTNSGILVTRNSTSVLNNVVVLGGKLTGTGRVLDVGGGTGTVSLRVEGTALSGCNRIAQVVGATLEFQYANLALAGMINQPLRISGGGVLNVRGYGWRGYATSAAVNAAGEVIRVVAPDFPVDLAVVAKNNGDMAFNTNAALASGAGPAVCNGTNWKNLYSGATY